MPTAYPAALMWFRRDLRASDNAALYRALRAARQVHCAFIFDRAILDGLPRHDRRVEFIRDAVAELDAALAGLSPGAGVLCRHALAADEIPRLARELGVQAVFTNHDDEPQALARDAQVRTALARDGIAFHTFKDHCIFERGEVLSQGGTPYAVFTPYKRAWLAKVDAFYLKSYPVASHAQALAPRAPGESVPSLEALGFETTNLRELGIEGSARQGAQWFAQFLSRIDDYGRRRDFPGVHGPSYLSVHLRFGTVSIRELAREAHARAQAGSEGAATWLSELIWRDFYFQVLANFPQVGQGGNFRPEYDAVRWEEGPEADANFAAWCEGRTGYPLVDAAMAQINRSGYMHNRLRMVVASFLTKDLGIDWRRGERYFALALNDYDLSANNGGWQWAASTGCDAQPWFRIFNPVSQSEKFDPDGRFIRRYLPQLAKLQGPALHAPWTATPLELEAAGIVLGRDYPRPIVDHAQAREQTLQRFAAVKKTNGA